MGKRLISKSANDKETMNLHDSYLKGLPFDEFIRRHGTEPQQARWRSTRK